MPWAAFRCARYCLFSLKSFSHSGTSQRYAKFLCFRVMCLSSSYLLEYILGQKEHFTSLIPKWLCEKNNLISATSFSQIALTFWWRSKWNLLWNFFSQFAKSQSNFGLRWTLLWAHMSEREISFPQVSQGTFSALWCLKICASKLCWLANTEREFVTLESSDQSLSKPQLLTLTANCAAKFAFLWQVPPPNVVEEFASQFFL